MRGAVLSGWMLFLTVVALWAFSGRLSRQLLGGDGPLGPPVRLKFQGTSLVFEQAPAATGVHRHSAWMLALWPPQLEYEGFRTDYRFSDGDLLPCTEATAALRTYLDDRRENPPPLGTVLDVLQPAWRDSVSLLSRYRPWNSPEFDYDEYQRRLARPCNREETAKLEAAYVSLFEHIETDLRVLVNDETVDLRSQKLARATLPAEFAALGATDAEVDLPAAAEQWVVAERERLKQYRSKLSLVDTFLLLSVLGAFGSLIFLTRDFITFDEEQSLSDYFFRPALGVFLAVALFLIDVFAASVVSRADILQIRYEPLYILGLAGGLLSDQAYEWVQERARRYLRERAEEKPPATKAVDPETASEPT